MQTVQDRFLRYVRFDTQSDETSPTCPSTPGQRTFGQALVEEMLAMGIKDAHMDDNGCIYGTVPGDPRLPTIGLIAHMDTSPDASGKDVQARVVPCTGEDILLNEKEDLWLRAAEYPSLREQVGKHLIVTDGTTLLGADDKAGIAEIMTAAEHLLTARRTHATLKIGFTPDEEIGRGADLFDVAKFGADYAYTVDGGGLGELEYENFNGASAFITVHGTNIHPGSAKDKMVNSILIAMELQSLLPIHQRPESTEGYEGFFHLNEIRGDVEQTQLHYIIRDHDMEKFTQKKQVMGQAVAFLNAKYGEGTVVLDLKESYYNMKDQILPHIHIVEKAKAAMEALGIDPKVCPIRGGTDGARLSFMGLPCPNLFTGGQNFHSRFEYVPVEDMEKCTQLLIDLLS